MQIYGDGQLAAESRAGWLEGHRRLAELRRRTVGAVGFESWLPQSSGGVHSGGRNPPHRITCEEYEIDRNAAARCGNVYRSRFGSGGLDPLQSRTHSIAPP